MIVTKVFFHYGKLSRMPLVNIQAWHHLYEIRVGLEFKNLNQWQMKQMWSLWFQLSNCIGGTRIMIKLILQLRVFPWFVKVYQFLATVVFFVQVNIHILSIMINKSPFVCSDLNHGKSVPFVSAMACEGLRLKSGLLLIILGFTPLFWDIAGNCNVNIFKFNEAGEVICQLMDLQ